MSTTTSAAGPRRGRRELIALALLCIAPLVASYFLYYVWQPTTRKNYGELIPIVSVPELSQSAASPVPPDLAPLKGKWLLVMVDSGACGDACREHLLHLRQLRLTQGKEMDRLVRLWLVDDASMPADGLSRDFEGTVILPLSRLPALAGIAGAPGAREHFYVIDPLGNLMMRFPAHPDLSRVKKDLIHLLKVSRIG